MNKIRLLTLLVAVSALWGGGKAPSHKRTDAKCVGPNLDNQVSNTYGSLQDCNDAQKFTNCNQKGTCRAINDPTPVLTCTDNGILVETEPTSPSQLLTFTSASAPASAPAPVDSNSNSSLTSGSQPAKTK